MFRRDVVVDFLKVCLHQFLRICFEATRLTHFLQIKEPELLSVFDLCSFVAENSRRFQNVFDAANGDDDPSGAVV